jgi:hypothetical protein
LRCAFPALPPLIQSILTFSSPPFLFLLQTLKHFVRDWSAEGHGERDALFPPILKALEKDFDDKAERRVLVPGCGLGRLAYEVASLGTLHLVPRAY